jgi:hypothetical protein
VFSQAALAEEKVQEMTERGLSPLVEVFERSLKEHWVLLEMGEDLKINQSEWAVLLKEQPKLETRQSFCVLGVASQENFL